LVATESASQEAHDFLSRLTRAPHVDNFKQILLEKLNILAENK